MNSGVAEETVRFDDLCGFSPKQKEAQRATRDFKFVLYGGAMGGGKSYWLRWQLLRILLKFGKEGHKNVVVGMFCEDYPALKDRQLSKIKFEFPSWLGTLSVTDHNFILRPEYGGGVLAFRNLDDASKYQSAEFAAIGVDEVTKNIKEVFDFLRTRLRWPGITNVRFLAASNPGGIGHAWVKKLWIDRQFEPNEPEPDQFVYIRALAKDNPKIDASYLKSLEGLPDTLRRAFLEGDWDIFRGQYFTEWRRDLHVSEPMMPAPYHKIFLCGDYGYLAPSAIYWCFKDSNKIVNVYRELYKTGLTYEKLAKEICAMTGPNEHIRYAAMDPAIWSTKGEVEVTGADLMDEVFRKHFKENSPMMVKGDNSRVIGWNVMREHLRPIPLGGKTVARLKVSSNCTELIRTLPTLVYDNVRVEDVDSDGEDHAADALRYGLMTDPPKSPNADDDIFKFSTGTMDKRGFQYK